MRYIGNKTKLLDFIEDSVTEICGDISEMSFCDLFSGTASVAKHFKSLCAEVTANDWEFYSYVLQRNYIGNNIKNIDPKIVDNYNNIKAVGLISENLSPIGQEGRKFFTEENAKLMDGCRQAIENDYVSGKISEDEYYFLLCSFIESSDKVANTTGVYGAFLKKFNGASSKTFKLRAHIPAEGSVGIPHQGDSNTYIKELKGDILYLDPPYNNRQYGSNYHVLNYIAKYEDVKFSTRIVDGQEVESKTALFDYNKSKYSQKAKALDTLDNLLSNADYKYIFISYNDEGIISLEDMKKTMNKHGQYILKTKQYQRYKSNTNKQSQNIVSEQLHILIKEEK